MVMLVFMMLFIMIMCWLLMGKVRFLISCILLFDCLVVL